jgi:hypothetical protein
MISDTKPLEEIKIVDGEVVDEVVEEGTEEEFEVEICPPQEYIQSAYFAISAVENIDTYDMTKEEARRIKRIKKMSVELIYESLCMLHSDFFEKEEDTES